jgi:hypothetical protein
MIKNNSLLVAGIACMLLGLPQSDSRAEDIRHTSEEKSQNFVIDEQISFIFLPDYGFSVSEKSPYDIIFSENLYYLFRDGVWYCSAFYRGPWNVVQKDGVPFIISSHRWEDIKLLRDEYRRRRNIMYWEESDRHNNRNQRQQQELHDPRIIKGQSNRMEKDVIIRTETSSYQK